jgi:DNA-directed RNA polymerase subunit RPC12/RpoP
MVDELGKKYPCFGEFKCPRCHKKWQSSKAWADYGQQCKHCATNVIPSNLRRLFVYICRNCMAKWKWVYVAEGLQCDKCKSSTLVRPLDQRNYQDREFIRAHRLEDLDNIDDENYIDPTKEHRQDLCEKCLRLGRPCRETAGREYRQRTDWVPQLTTSSSASHRASLTVPQSTTSSSASYQSSSTLSPPVDRSNNSSTEMIIASVVLVVFGSLIYHFFAR